jgi:alkylation response protein AidB-like acyl-CoA dehydrogenase
MKHRASKMDAEISAEESDRVVALRAEVRRWINENLPTSLRTPAKQEEYYQSIPVYPEGDDWKLWKDRIISKGWGVPSWPVEYGGAGRTAVEGHAIAQEFLEAGAFNPIMGLGAWLLGPVLLEHGTSEQKQLHLPLIARGEVKWCQGFSEPGAGSDLAALQTKAEDRGDHYLVNGQKIWTSRSVDADWCFCLVRTDGTRKQGGISFLLIDMRMPGIEVRPIRMISGVSLFSEVFFTDVRVPKGNLVGKINEGWTLAKELLQHERHTVTNDRGEIAGDTRSIAVIAKEYVGLDQQGRLANPDLRQRIIRHLMEFKALAFMQARMVEESEAHEGLSEATSVLKNARARIQQEREELLIEIMGVRGLGGPSAGFSEVELDTTRAFLHNKAMTIYSGTTEIQNNIIAKRVLGLADNQQARSSRGSTKDAP